MNRPSSRDWSPFVTTPKGRRPPAPRALETPEGVGDRLRAAAFAEIQAREAFLWASEHFETAPPALKTAWRALAKEEDKHLHWLLTRLQELGFEVQERPVSDYLWDSFMNCTSAEKFALYMASAEERGRKAGERFYENLKNTDPQTAEIFRKIAEEELAHIRLAERFFPQAPVLPNPPSPRAVESRSADSTTAGV